MSRQKKSARVLLLPLTDTLGAASRYRVYQYVPFLEKAGYRLKIWPAVGNQIYERRASKPTIFTKIPWLLARVFRRLAVLFFVRRFDIVFLQRETMPYGFPLIDLVICRLARRIVFDFDDAIYASAEKLPKLVARFADPRRAERIFSRCDVVIAANRVLAESARQYAKKVAIIPSALNFAEYRRSTAREKSDPPIIGWIGSPFTAFYLEMLFPVFSKLAKIYTFEVHCIGADFHNRMDFSLKCRPWVLEREVADIMSFDIGVMPLTDDLWSRGKSGLKLLQYLAAGVAAVASPVGVNKEIITHGQNGLLAGTPKEWQQNLARLLEDEALRRKLADSANMAILSKFDIHVTAEQLIQLFETL